MKPIRRGEVHLVSLAPVRGRERAGRRPVLVVSSDAVNARPLVVVVVVGTDGRHIPRDYPSNVRVPPAESGLPRETVFLGFQVRSLDPSRFADPRTGEPAARGTLPPSRMRRVDEALRRVLALQGEYGTRPL